MNGRQIITLLTAGVSSASLSCSQQPTGDLQQALDKLAKTKPAEKEVLVTCYKMMLPGRAEQVFKCTVCGEKTVYPAKTRGAGAVDKLWQGEGKFSAEAERGMKKFGVTIKVDDREFCQSCRKKDFAGVNKELRDRTVKDEELPRRAWLISRVDAAGKPLPGSPWRIYTDKDDHKILEAFFSGKDTIIKRASTVALKRYIARLAELLKLKK